LQLPITEVASFENLYFTACFLHNGEPEMRAGDKTDSIFLYISTEILEHHFRTISLRSRFLRNSSPAVAATGTPRDMGGLLPEGAIALDKEIGGTNEGVACVNPSSIRSKLLWSRLELLCFASLNS